MKKISLLAVLLSVLMIAMVGCDLFERDTNSDSKLNSSSSIAESEELADVSEKETENSGGDSNISEEIIIVDESETPESESDRTEFNEDTEETTTDEITTEETKETEIKNPFDFDEDDDGFVDGWY